MSRYPRPPAGRSELTFARRDRDVSSRGHERHGRLSTECLLGSQLMALRRAVRSP